MGVGVGEGEWWGSRAQWGNGGSVGVGRRVVVLKVDIIGFFTYFSPGRGFLEDGAWVVR